MSSVADNRYGFVWTVDKGLPVIVERAISDRGYVVLTIKRGGYMYDVQISPTGRVGYMNRLKTKGVKERIWPSQEGK